MKLLLTYLLVTFVLALRTARKPRPILAWPLVIAAFFVGAAYLTRRAIG
jgi:lipopolysaccharide export LptBFGC system permease protein LptF